MLLRACRYVQALRAAERQSSALPVLLATWGRAGGARTRNSAEQVPQQAGRLACARSLLLRPLCSSTWATGCPSGRARLTAPSPSRRCSGSATRWVGRRVGGAVRDAVGRLAAAGAAHRRRFPGVRTRLLQTSGAPPGCARPPSGRDYSMRLPDHGAPCARAPTGIWLPAGQQQARPARAAQALLPDAVRLPEQGGAGGAADLPRERGAGAGRGRASC